MRLSRTWATASRRRSFSLSAWSIAWLWQRRPHGYLIVGAGLVMWAVESACVAVDQWYGRAANPAST